MRTALSTIAALFLLGGPHPLAASPVALSGSSSVAPCDIYGAAGTPCVAAHSVTRRMWKGYSGPLFQIVRASDSATLNVGFLQSGIVNKASIDAFCAGTACKYTNIFDQMHNATSGNNLPQATSANQAPVTFTTFTNGKLPMLATVPGQFYRNRAATVGIPTGNSSITEYMVNNSFTWSDCCGQYGNMESTVADTGAGHMFATMFGTTGGTTFGTGNGPWPGTDWENGVNLYGPTLPAIMVNGLSKYNSGSTTYTVKSDAGVTGAYTVLNSGAPPATAAFEGGLSIGEGGDGSPAPVGFFEGVVIAAATTDATDNAIAANVARFYNGTPTSPAQATTLEVNQCVANPGASCTANFTASVPAGNTIILVTNEAVAALGAETVTDTQGNTYALAVQQFENCSSASSRVISIFYAPVVHPLTVSDTLTISVTASTRVIFDAISVAGLSAAPLDSASAASACGATGVVQTVTSGTPVQGNELFVAQDNASSGVSNPPTGWLTHFGLFFNNWGNAGQVRNPANVPITWKDDTAAGNWAAVIAGFKTP